jgi:hypothetical protein
MTRLLNASSPNKTLKGHKLLLLVPWTPSKDFLDRLQSEHPDLNVVRYELNWAEASPRSDFPPEEWRDVTILLTGTALPAVGVSPKLEYVQLMSAGANHILKNPLFTDTDVTFCTANGVHGFVSRSQ